MGSSVTTPYLAPQQGQTVAVMPDGYVLPLRVHHPAGAVKGVILALHGMNDYGAAWDDPAPWFTAEGLVLYAPDLRGFGRTASRGYWPGEASLVADVHSLLRVLATRHPGVPLYLMGESMGGALALAALTASEAPPVRGAVLLAPAVWGRQSMGLVPRTALAVADALIPGFPVSGEGSGIQASDNLEALRKLGRDPLVLKQTRVDAVRGLVDLMDTALAAGPRLTVPTLLIYGRNDQLIPPAPVCQLLGSVPATTALTVRWPAGGWHLLLRDLGGRAVAEEILRWIRGGPGLSGQRADYVLQAGPMPDANPPDKNCRRQE